MLILSVSILQLSQPPNHSSSRGPHSLFLPSSLRVFCIALIAITAVARSVDSLLCPLPPSSLVLIFLIDIVTYMGI